MRNKQQTIKYRLLITAIFALLLACKPSYNLVSGVYNNQVISPEMVDTDSSFVKLYLPYKEKLDAEMDEVIGFAQTELVKNKPESKMTNFLADLLLEETSIILNKSGQSVTPDLSFLNYGGIRTGISQGDITVRKIFEVMPFENELVVLQLSGAEVQQFLDLIASRGGDSLSGVRFRIRDNKAVDVIIGGRPLSADRNYWLATSDYVADGGDSYSMLQNHQQRINTDEKIRDVIIHHLKKSHAQGIIINPLTDGRIINE
jgi:2',3'-cyclic-nucleotide 2'-phosphodiesterase (5'-nucleotidase family)